MGVLSRSKNHTTLTTHSQEQREARKCSCCSSSLSLLNGFRYGVVTALYNVIWSYIGYSNANYALSETRNPVRTLKIAAPTALISVAVIYMFVNVSLLLLPQINLLLRDELTNIEDRLFCCSPEGRDPIFRSHSCSLVLPKCLRRPCRARSLCLCCFVSLWQRSQCYFLPRSP